MSKVADYYEKVKDGVEDVKQAYFEYLCSIVGAERGNTSYYILLRKLFEKEFYALIPNDENRAMDGKCLRDEFAESTDYISYEEIDGPCNMLEFMIGISRRMANLTYKGDDVDRTSEYFWEILENLLAGHSSKILEMRLKQCSDPRISPTLLNLFDLKLDTFLERKILKNGILGFFPKKISGIDQNEIEIWSQMQYYLMSKKT